MNSHPFYLTPDAASFLLARSLIRRAEVLNVRAQRRALFVHHLTIPEAQRLGAAEASAFLQRRIARLSPAVAANVHRHARHLIA